MFRVSVTKSVVSQPLARDFLGLGLGPGWAAATRRLAPLDAKLLLGVNLEADRTRIAEVEAAQAERPQRLCHGRVTLGGRRFAARTPTGTLPPPLLGSARPSNGTYAAPFPRTAPRY